MNDAASMATEIEIMKRVRHRHVVSLFVSHLTKLLNPLSVKILLLLLLDY